MTQVRTEIERRRAATLPAPREPGASGGEQPARTGVWLVGARGSVATTTVVGAAAALRAGAAAPVGCVSTLPPFQALALPAFDDLVFGGHDLTQTALPKR